MRFLSIILFLLSLPLSAADLSRDAQRAITAHDQAVAEAKAIYEKALAEAAQTLVTQLETEMEKATKRADLDGAIALRDKIEEVKQCVPEQDEGSLDLLRAGDGPQVKNEEKKGDILSLDAARAEAAMRLATTEKGWESVPGEAIQVSINHASTPSGITLREGDVYLMLPHPTDMWAGSNWRGLDRFPDHNGLKGVNGQALIWSIGGVRSGSQKISGIGELTFRSNITMFAGKYGTVRVKLIKVE